MNKKMRAPVFQRAIPLIYGPADAGSALDAAESKASSTQTEE
jgi:hypothetical protein